MKYPGHVRILAAIWVAALCLHSAGASDQTTLVERLAQTRAVNHEAIVDSQFDEADRPGGFRVADPYAEKATDIVQQWSQSPASSVQVCAIRFVDDDLASYKLRGFDSGPAARIAGFKVTHQGRCGSCSTLQDLAIYLSTPDLTSPARQCARKIGLKRKKQCFQERLGFTAYCAESWAYNALHTRRECLGACITDYGFFNLLFGRYPGANVDEYGQLRPCLQCDENMSGAGFKYSAGRTRRNSGIESAIERPAAEIFTVDHSAYFQ
jgi:hypothetical protein